MDTLKNPHLLRTFGSEANFEVIREVKGRKTDVTSWLKVAVKPSDHVIMLIFENEKGL